jgi:hypothetical protein
MRRADLPAARNVYAIPAGEARAFARERQRRVSDVI